MAIKETSNKPQVHTPATAVSTPATPGSQGGRARSVGKPPPVRTEASVGTASTKPALPRRELVGGRPPAPRGPDGTGAKAPFGAKDLKHQMKATPAPAKPQPKMNHGLVLDHGTSLREMAAHFKSVGEPGKHLRLHVHADGHAELHTYGRLELNTEGAQKRKHEGAFNAVRDMLVMELHISPHEATMLMKKNGAKDGLIELRTLEKLVNHLDLAKMRSNEAAARADRSGHQKNLQDFKTGQLALDANSAVTMSDKGSGGVLKVGPKGQPPVAMVKVEVAESLQSTHFFSTLVETLDAEATQRLPFDLPAHELVKIQGPQLDELEAHLADLAAKTTDPSDTRAAKQSEQLVTKTSAVVSKFEPLQGKALSELPLEQRQKLVHSGQLAHQFGEVAVFFSVLGFTDHVSTYADGNVGGTNPSNLILGQDGRLKAIDFAVVKPPPMSGPPLQGTTPEQVKAKVTTLLGFLQSAAQPANKDAYLQDQLNAAKSGNPDDSHPISNALQTLVAPLSGPDDLFKLTETSQAEFDAEFSELDQQVQWVEMVRGIFDSLEFLHDNGPAFAKAHDAANKALAADPSGAPAAVNGMATPAQTFEIDIPNLLQQADLPALKGAFEATWGHIQPTQTS